MAPRTMRGLFVALVLMAGGTPVLAQGTDQQREACTPDAFRFCTAAMPDAGRVEDRLRRAGPQLSPACYAVFYPPKPPGALGQSRGAGERQRLPRQQPTQGVPVLPDADD